MSIDWQSSKTEIFTNSRMPFDEQELVLATLKNHPLAGHVWLSTSGSTGQIKWVALSKEAFLCSAEILNAHLKSTRDDIWVRSLPIFHVGGLSILARAHLSKARVVEFSGKWDPLRYHELINNAQGTLTSLVAAQVYDIVALGLKAPPSLRAVLVGGGALQESLYKKAYELGWPLVPTYGMTETATGIASGLYPVESQFPLFKPLPHVDVQISSTGRIRIKSQALFSFYAIITKDHVRFDDPKIDGWYTSEDRGRLENGFLTILGRDTSFVKVGGESVDLQRLEKILEEIKLANNFQDDLVLLPIPDLRLGHVIHLATTCKDESQLQALLERFHMRIMPFEKIRRVYTLPYIPRSPLQKVLPGELMRMLHAY